MTKDEFMEYATTELDAILLARKGQILNLMNQAYAEGKKHAEVDKLMEIGEGFIKALEERFSVKEPSEAEKEDDSDANDMLRVMFNRCWAAKWCGGYL